MKAQKKNPEILSRIQEKLKDNKNMDYLKKGFSQKRYLKAKKIIPGGVQLLSKKPEMFLPEQWPTYFSKADGCEVWDIDGRHYYDMVTNGIGTCLLGFNHPEVTEAVIERIQNGSMCSLNPPEEVELAEKLCSIHPWAEQVRFARTGGETAAVAVRIARATSKRDIIAVCGYHGWHDWYLAANLNSKKGLDGHLIPGLDPAGVPRGLAETTVTFRYNNFEDFDKIIKKYGSRLAAVIMEPARNSDPEPGFLQHIRKKTEENGILLIFDEITIAWRINYGGYHLKLGVDPDIAIYAKALGNGHPIGAIIGTKKAMTGALDSFISSTYWTESVGPVAALASLKIMENINVPEHVNNVGIQILSIWEKYAKKYHIEINTDNCYPALAHFHFKHKYSNELKTNFTKLMLSRGFLASTMIYPTLAHNNKIISLFDNAVDEAFAELVKLVENNSLLNKEKSAQKGFARLT